MTELRPPASFDAEAFASLAEQLHSAGDNEQTSEQVVATAVDVLGADGGSVSMLARGKRLKTVAPTDDRVVLLDQLQYQFDEGPCYDASWRGETLMSPDLTRELRWPQWTRHALQHGIGAMLAVELATPTKRVGALNLYFAGSKEFTEDDLAFVAIFGRHASVVVAAKTSNSELVTALDSRQLIGQAQGMLMERFGLSDHRSFEVLRRYSTDNNLRLRDVAEELVRTRALPAVGADVSDGVRGGT